MQSPAGWIMQTLSTAKRHSVIRNIQISNFKSIASQSIPLGRFTVLIGENGAGKSNILEALVMASAASTGRLEREILIGRGMRMTSPTLMRSAFEEEENKKPIEIAVTYKQNGHEKDFFFSITHDGKPYSDWHVAKNDINPDDVIKDIDMSEWDIYDINMDDFNGYTVY